MEIRGGIILNVGLMIYPIIREGKRILFTRFPMLYLKRAFFNLCASQKRFVLFV